MFKGIEGARAWLAWSVVAAHIALYSGLSRVLPHGDLLRGPGDQAVGVFIIISGFVITNLVVTKHEPYGLYLTRRVLRIYPAYLISLAFCVVLAPLAYQTLETYRFSESAQVGAFAIESREYARDFWPQFTAHLSLLHGMFPNRIMPKSEYMFMPPAWSLSLEWQFFLIAPVWIWAIIRFPLRTVAVTLLGVALYDRYLGGGFGNPSLLPGAGLYFLAGIGTRLGIERMPKLTSYPFAVLLGLASLTLHDSRLVPFVAWVALVAYLLQARDWRALDGRLARAAGARSYSVYILHWPVLCAALYLSISILKLPLWPTVGLTAAITVLGTLAASEAVFRFVETPAINFARELGRRRTPIDVRTETAGW